MKNKIDLIVINAKELLTLSGPHRARAGKEMNELEIIENGAIAVNKGKIVNVGFTNEIKKKYKDR